MFVAVKAHVPTSTSCHILVERRGVGESGKGKEGQGGRGRGREGEGGREGERERGVGGGRERERERERRRERGSGKAACLGQGDTPCAGCRLQAAAAILFKITRRQQQQQRLTGGGGATSSSSSAAAIHPASQRLSHGRGGTAVAVYCAGPALCFPPHRPPTHLLLGPARARCPRFDASQTLAHFCSFGQMALKSWVFPSL